ncbi:MAG: polyprenyl synthetase family protein [Candidatus Omnitrophica bacterium]|nr:polyprenyl synthetase family protein [Candidatus Omnitrophota bacterium]
MLKELKKRIDCELRNFVKSAENTFGLKSLSPLLFRTIENYILRDGKRIRPILFIVGYQGFSKKTPKALYQSALAIELMHDFMLIHDDIIDKSELRRGQPSLHTIYNKFLQGKGKAKFSGEDLAIVAGDIIYALSINAFLAIDEDPRKKERALRMLTETAAFTGCGQFIEILNGVKDINRVKEEDIYNIYNYKTARYTFASPLCIGATLAGASEREIDNLFDYGLFLGQAFQIKDDILGMFGDEAKIGKSITSDLQESKKTLLILKAFQRASFEDKTSLKRILGKEKIRISDIRKAKKIIKDTGSLEFSMEKIKQLQNKAQAILASSSIKRKQKDFLADFSKKTLNL